MARLNKKSLADAIALHESLGDAPKYKVEEIVDLLFDTIENAIVAGDTVAIAGFGKFENFTSSTTGKKKAKFSQYKELKEKVNA